MWRFFNVMQFLDGFICVSKKGLDESAYSQLIITTDVIADSAMYAHSSLGEWQEILDMITYSDDTAKELIDYAIKDNLPLPEIGYEVVDDNDRVIGEIEIAWTDKKIGYITDSYQDIKEEITTMGWTVVSSVEELTGAYGGK